MPALLLQGRNIGVQAETITPSGENASSGTACCRPMQRLLQSGGQEVLRGPVFLDSSPSVQARKQFE